MKSVKLNNGVEMPVLGFGVYQLTDLAVCEQAVTDALEVGYRLIDTASAYNNEEAVGAAIRKSSVPRGDIFLTTKAIGNEMGYDDVKDAFKRSCDKLGTDYLDLYLIHLPLGDYFGAWRAMEQLYEAGRIRAIGISNFTADRVVDFCRTVRILPAVNQIEIHPFCQQRDNLGILSEFGVRPQAWSSFASGFNGIFSNPVLKAIAESHGKSIAQVILRWNVERGVVAISKSVHKSRMEDNLKVFDFSLSEEDRSAIATLDTGRPMLLDLRNPNNVKAFYDSLEHPV